MKARPILFSGQMVRAILDGRKTQTRRIVKPHPDGDFGAPFLFQNSDDIWTAHDPRYPCEHGVAGEWHCPYGAPGDRREARWRLGIHMPRLASRITLEIVNVRVERLQEIREDDAKAEGCQPVTHEDGAVDCGTRKTTFAKLWDSINAKRGYGWEANPHVWVIEFRMTKDAKE